MDEATCRKSPLRIKPPSATFYHRDNKLLVVDCSLLISAILKALHDLCLTGKALGLIICLAFLGFADKKSEKPGSARSLILGKSAEVRVSFPYF